jgi:hypothetical protein
MKPFPPPDPPYDPIPIRSHPKPSGAIEWLIIALVLFSGVITVLTIGARS